ncbi:efflux RND transporter periplasmic adaptor subunit [Lysobacter sp. GX 14042]|uniref:efflux RND transporter periplasmic adaptor subunit n=1 Tax=Lysobacter sp. GX 14042 TaxID=2907155 RepID=UPI001F3F4973|nr:efflux RND transporter periplasmic adaptor subunit [Lysobacter sp. GX 14042]MCE7031100.1 efflux RND transporter periplasmic adaptor subunit [Lysobacter sp. GX 14042]
MAHPSRSRAAASAHRRRWRTPLVIAVVVLLVLAGAWWWQGRAGGDAGSGYRTATVERGDIRVVISATGTLRAISTVDVGSQISGLVTEVLADFNDQVSRGQVIARIDPSTYQAQIEQGTASANAARASLATAEAALRNAEADYRRKSELGRSQLVSASDVDVARTALDQARAQVNAARAQITQQQASTQTSRLNLERTEIRSPVDGVVLTRTVEPGQTVAASLQAPVLFQIAEDLSQMEIELAIDEADIGQVVSGQGVSFTVDAFPDRRFRGEVQQIRLSATNTNNVITYPVVVAVDNADQVLLPGMTANAEIEVSRRDAVLRVPNAALRYKPAEDAGIAPPQRGAGGFDGDIAALGAGLGLDATQQSALDAALERMRGQAAQRRTAAASTGAGAGGPAPQAAGGAPSGDMQAAMRQRTGERLAAQFADFRATLDEVRQAEWDRGLAALAGARRAPLYLLEGGGVRAVMVRVGASDGSWTEVSGPLEDGDQVVVGSERPS